MSVRYYTKVKEVPKGPGNWSHLDVKVFEARNGEERQIGSYERNYSSFFKTFLPFELGGEWYALYSPRYTATRVMKLPSCEDIGGEEENAYGFCPTAFWVPKLKEDGLGVFGFVTGCVWGDDSSMKIELLDMRRVRDGVIKRVPGYYIEYGGSTMNIDREIDADGSDDGIMLQLPILGRFTIDPTEDSLVLRDASINGELFSLQERKGLAKLREDGTWCGYSAKDPAPVKYFTSLADAKAAADRPVFINRHHITSVSGESYDPEAQSGA